MSGLSLFTGVLGPLRYAIHWWIATSVLLHSMVKHKRRPRAPSAATPPDCTRHATTLGNSPQSQALLGYIKPKPTSFERLSFAARLIRERLLSQNPDARSAASS